MKNLLSIFAIILVQYAFCQPILEDRSAYEEYESSVLYIQMKSGTVFGDVTIDRNHSELLIGYPELQAFFGQGVLTEMKLEFKKLAKRSEQFNRIYRVRVADGIDLDDLVKELKQLNYIAISEKIPLYKLSLVPNDPDYATPSKRWHLDQIDAELAWNITQGCASVKIAIVDDAVMTNHQDLQSKIYTNSGEIPANGIDDDGNGYIDDVNGFDVADNDPNASPPGFATSSYFSHGTHVAGIAGGASNNGVGLASMGYNSSIIPIKTKSNTSTNPAALNNPMQGVEYAIVIGADVINMSWGSYAPSSINQMVFNQANIEGIICVAAVGNDSQSFIAYPANYNGVISVVATNSSDDIASFSNFSQEQHVFAPGVDIWSAEAGSTSSYGFKSGTSMATPLTSGLIALMLCNNPGYSLFDIQYCLHYNSDMITSVALPGIIIPRVNAYQTLTCSLPTYNSCLPNGCELIVNGSLEIPQYSNLVTYSDFGGISYNELCGWEDHPITVDIFPLDVSAPNHYAHMQCYMQPTLSQFEGLITKNPLTLIPGATYQLEFDYCVMRDVSYSIPDHLDSIAIKLIPNNWSPVPGSYNINNTEVIGAILDPPLDYVHPQWFTWSQNAVTPDSLFNHYLMTFVALSDPNLQTLLIHPVSDYLGIGTSGLMGLGIDNISIRPVTDVAASTNDYTPTSNDCVTLTATTPGTYVYWEPSTLFADPTLPVQTICLDTMETCPGGTLEFTVTALDTTVGCASSDTVVLNIQGTDADSPVFNTATLDDYSDCNSIAYITPPTASDNCAGTIVGVPDVSFPITTLGTTIITWTYDDGNGNTSIQTQNVMIEDVTDPVPNVAVLSSLNGECNVTLPVPFATDDCAGSIVGVPDVSFPINTPGTTVVTWTYDDGNGNSATQTQDVVLADVTGPMPDVAILPNINGECEATPPVPLATDYCTGAAVGTPDVSFPITTQGTTTVTWTYVDGIGNSSTQTQDVIISDLTAPVTDSVSLADVNSECEVTPTAPTATDNCSGAITGVPDLTFPITAAGTTTITWTFDDGHGNSTTQTQDIVITPINNGATQVDALTISADAVGYNYQWVDCNNGNAPIPGATSQVFTPTIAGSYACVVDNGTCSVTTACLTSSVGIIENDYGSGLLLYPNPTNGKFSIELGGNYHSVTYTLIDSKGRLVQSNSYEETHELNITLDEPAGVYMITVESENKRAVLRIVKK